MKPTRLKRHVKSSRPIGNYCYMSDEQRARRFTTRQRSNIYLRAAELIHPFGVEHYCLAAIEEVVNPPCPQERKNAKKETDDFVFLREDDLNRRRKIWLSKKWAITETAMPELALFMPDGGHFNQCWTSVGGATRQRLLKTNGDLKRILQLYCFVIL